jgi:protein-tyrosine-phosphatase
MKIMFVCTANTCRSAMAEAIFKKMTNHEVYSCGTHARTGQHVAQNTLDVCANYGIDMSKHESTNFRQSNIAEMDLVLTATETHKQILKGYYKELDIYTIKEYAKEYPYDINDPVGGTLVAYDACFNEIYDVLEKIKLILE